MSVTPLKNNRAQIKCPVCDREWEGRLRENITCARMHGGCGTSFKYRGFKVEKIMIPRWLEWMAKEKKLVDYKIMKGT